MKLKYFGTDGIRGRYGEGPIQVNFAWRLGQALANFIATKKQVCRSMSLWGEIRVRGEHCFQMRLRVP